MNRYLLLVLVSFQLIACHSSNDSKVEAYIKQVRDQLMQEPEPISPFEKLPSFHYPHSDSRANPFRLAKIENKTRSKQPLEYFPLASLNFVGFLKKNSETWGLINRMNGELFSIKVGEFMGENEGKVIEIKEDSLRLEEKIIVAGKLATKIKEIYLVEGA